MSTLKTLKSVYKISSHEAADSFLNSLPYFMLTGRHGLKKYHDGECSIFICVHPHDKNTILIFPETNGNGNLTVKILNKLSQTKYKVQLARYTDKDIQQLNDAIERDRLKLIASIDIKEEDIMDWKYPAHILDTKLVSEMKGSKFSKLRNKFNKVSKNFTIQPLSSPDTFKTMRSLILFWAAEIIYAGKESNHDMTEFYDTLVKHIQEFPSLFDGFIVLTNRKPLGFTVWDYAGNTANALAGLNQRSISGMSEFQTVTACKILREKGIKEYNIGGSEGKQLNTYKEKFRPIKSIALCSLDVKFVNLAMVTEKTVNIVRSDNPEFNNL